MATPPPRTIYVMTPSSRAFRASAHKKALARKGTPHSSSAKKRKALTKDDDDDVEEEQWTEDDDGDGDDNGEEGGSRLPDDVDDGTTAVPAPAANGRVLQGTVVYVDVRTAGGADASALFVEAVLEMGARGGGGGGRAAPSRHAISHVVFRNGSARTLEKVRRSEGVVSCVGAGWVLDCERHNAWLSEKLYAVDLRR
ncbi:MAG: hypothetical protein M1826_002830 [Phylliscum demangeonii]|nr:MAG: hypothetical protein M1826_002830 [Phylliscum demangeonii]